MANTQKQEQIIDWMIRFDLTESKLAQWIGIKPNKFAYQINNAIEIKEIYFNEIKKQLIGRKYLSDQDECKQLFELTTEFFGSVSTQFNLFSNEVCRAVKDKSLTKDERMRLKVKVDDFLTATITRSNEIKNLLGMK